MKSQWLIVCGLGLALLTAVAAVSNTQQVKFDFYWGEVQSSLIIIISASILLGGVLVALFGTLRSHRLRRDRDRLLAEKDKLSKQNLSLQKQLSEAELAYQMLIRDKPHYREAAAGSEQEPGESYGGNTNKSN